MSASIHKQRVAAYQNAIQNAFFASGAPIRSFKALQEAVEAIPIMTGDQRLWESVITVNETLKMRNNKEPLESGNINDSTEHVRHKEKLGPLRRVHMENNNEANSPSASKYTSSSLPSIHNKPSNEPSKPFLLPGAKISDESFTRSLSLVDFNSILADLVVRLEKSYSGMDDDDEDNSPVIVAQTKTQSVGNRDRKTADTALIALLNTLKNDLFYLTDPSTKKKSGTNTSDDDSSSTASDAEHGNPFDYSAVNKKGSKKEQRKTRSKPTRPTLGPNPFSSRNQQLQQLSRSGTLSNSFFIGGGGSEGLSTNNIRRLLSAGAGKSNLSVDALKQASSTDTDPTRPSVTAAHLSYFLRHFFLDGDAIVKALIDKMATNERSHNSQAGVAFPNHHSPSSEVPTSPKLAQTPHIASFIAPSKKKNPKSDLQMAFEERKNQLLREQHRRAAAHAAKEFESQKRQNLSRAINHSALNSPNQLTPQLLQLQHHNSSQTPSQLSRLRQGSSSSRTPSVHPHDQTISTLPVTTPNANDQSNTSNTNVFVFTGFANETDPVTSLMEVSHSAMDTEINNNKEGGAGIHFVENEDTLQQHNSFKSRQSPATGIISLSPAALSIPAPKPNSPRPQPLQPQPQRQQRRQSVSLTSPTVVSNFTGEGNAPTASNSNVGRRGSAASQHHPPMMAMNLLSPQSLALTSTSTHLTPTSVPTPSSATANVNLDIATLMARSKHLQRRVSVAANRVESGTGVTSGFSALPPARIHRTTSQANSRADSEHHSMKDSSSAHTHAGQSTAKVFLSRHEKAIIIPPEALLELFYGLFGGTQDDGSSSFDEDLVTPMSQAIVALGNYKKHFDEPDGTVDDANKNNVEKHTSTSPLGHLKKLESQSVAELLAYLEHAHETQVRRQMKIQTDYSDYLVNAITTGDLLLRRQNIGRPTKAAIRGDLERDKMVLMDTKGHISDQDRQVLRQANAYAIPSGFASMSGGGGGGGGSSTLSGAVGHRHSSANNIRFTSSNSNLSNLLNANPNLSAASSMSHNINSAQNANTSVVGGGGGASAQHVTPIFLNDASYLDGSDYDEELDGPPTFTPSGGIILYRRDGGQQEMDDEDNILVSGLGMEDLLTKGDSAEKQNPSHTNNTNSSPKNYKHKTRLLKALVDAGAEGVDVAEVQFLQAQHEKNQVAMRVDAKVNIAAIERITVAEDQRDSASKSKVENFMGQHKLTGESDGNGEKSKKSRKRGGGVPSSLYPSTSPWMPAIKTRKSQSRDKQLPPIAASVTPKAHPQPTGSSLNTSLAEGTERDPLLGISRNSRLDYSSPEEDLGESNDSLGDKKVPQINLPPGAKLIDGIIVKPHITFKRNTPMSQLDPWLQTQLRRNYTFISPYPRIDMSELARRQEAIRWISHRRKMEEKYAHLASPERAMGLTQIKITGVSESLNSFSAGDNNDSKEKGNANIKGLSTSAQTLPPLSKAEMEEIDKLVSEEMKKFELEEKRAEERKKRQQEKKKEAFDAAIAANRAANGNSSLLGSRAVTPSQIKKTTPQNGGGSPSSEMASAQTHPTVGDDPFPNKAAVNCSKSEDDEEMLQILSDGRIVTDLDDQELVRQLAACDVIIESLESANTIAMSHPNASHDELNGEDNLDPYEALYENDGAYPRSKALSRESFKMKHDKRALEAEMSARLAPPVGESNQQTLNTSALGRPTSTLTPSTLVAAIENSPQGPIHIFNPRQHFTKPQVEEFPNPAQKHNRSAMGAGVVGGKLTRTSMTYRKEVGGPRTATAVQQQLDIDPEFFVQYVKHVAISQGARPSSVYSESAQAPLDNKSSSHLTPSQGRDGKAVTKERRSEGNFARQTVKQRQVEKQRRQEKELIEWALKLRRDGFQV